MLAHPISVDVLKAMFSFSPEDGLFRYINSRGRQASGSIAGTTNKWGHIEIHISKKKYLAHRLAWLYHYGEWPSGMIDHINRIPSDNSIANLRICSFLENMQNRDKAHKINKSGLIGASLDKKTGKWKSQIRMNYKIHYIGVFDSAEDAHRAYMLKKSELHGYYNIKKDSRHD